MPNGRELARYLAEIFRYREDEPENLWRVSQFVYVKRGAGKLYDKLHELYKFDYPPTLAHRFLARIPELLRGKGVTDKYPIIVTANFDGLLERAFQQANEEFDLLWYVPESDQDMHGKLYHRAPGGIPQPIKDPESWFEVRPDKRTVIIKLHGLGAQSGDKNLDSFVITENHLLKYLSDADALRMAPVTLRERLVNSHYLFMGYSLRDWNLRVMLYRLWGGYKIRYASWAIQRNPRVTDIDTWQAQGVEIKDKLLEEYIVGLERHLEEIQPRRYSR